jgi:acetylglutamate kinase
MNSKSQQPTAKSQQPRAQGPKPTALSIVKIGGNIIDNPLELEVFLTDFAQKEGLKILVHGGGKSATKMAESLGLNPVLIDGRRITDAAMLDVAVMMYAGQINKNIVASLQAKKCNAIGFSGADGNLIQSTKRNHPTIDYGFVGDVQAVNSNLLANLLDAGIIPVFCAITHDKKGQLLNTNADTIASELANAMALSFKVTLTYCFEKQGVLMDSEDDSTIILNLDLDLYQKLKDDKAIHSGMLPKLDNCFKSLSKGVQEVKIGHYKILKNKQEPHTSISL